MNPPSAVAARTWRWWWTHRRDVTEGNPLAAVVLGSVWGISNGLPLVLLSADRPAELHGVGRLHTLADADALRAAFETAGVDLTKPVVTTCGSGITAAVLTLAYASAFESEMVYSSPSKPFASTGRWYSVPAASFAVTVSQS